MVSTEIVRRILKARENRALRHNQFKQIYLGTIVSFTMNVPGQNKNTKYIEKAFAIGVESIKLQLSSRRVNVLKHETNISDDGPESCWIVDTPPSLLKKWMMEIEESHKLGRLFDIDVLDDLCRPIHREGMGKTVRTCLICDGPAHGCARSQKHKYEELHHKIQEMIETYLEVNEYA